MKTLILIRHAKSSWSNVDLVDFDRPLNERGKKDAPMMAEKMIKKKIKLDAIISSPARRARKTAEAFCEVYGIKENRMILIDKLYHAAPDTFYEVITEADDKFDRVSIFSHNPGITDFVNELIEGVRIDNVPTCGVFALECNIKKWKDFKQGEKKLLFFDFPKNLS
jgi:phosphohistidine phosphatase